MYSFYCKKCGSNFMADDKQAVKDYKFEHKFYDCRRRPSRHELETNTHPMKFLRVDDKPATMARPELAKIIVDNYNRKHKLTKKEQTNE